MGPARRVADGWVREPMAPATPPPATPRLGVTVRRILANGQMPGMLPVAPWPHLPSRVS